jgi:hypothetical protein
MESMPVVAEGGAAGDAGRAGAACGTFAAGTALDAAAALPPSSVSQGNSTRPTTVKTQDRVAAIVPATLSTARLRRRAKAEKATASGKKSDGAEKTPSNAQTMPRRPVTAPAPEALRAGVLSASLSTAGDGSPGGGAPDVGDPPAVKEESPFLSMAAPE